MGQDGTRTKMGLRWNQHGMGQDGTRTGMGSGQDGSQDRTSTGSRLTHPGTQQGWAQALSPSPSSLTPTPQGVFPPQSPRTLHAPGAWDSS